MIGLDEGKAGRPTPAVKDIGPRLEGVLNGKVGRMAGALGETRPTSAAGLCEGGAGRSAPAEKDVRLRQERVPDARVIRMANAPEVTLPASKE